MKCNSHDRASFNIQSGGATAPPVLRFAPPLELVLPLKKCPFFKRLLFFYWETQSNATCYNTTLRDLVKIGPFDAICPPSEHFLKEALYVAIYQMNIFVCFKYKMKFSNTKGSLSNKNKCN